MLICLDCQRTFQEPRRYTESHGLDSGPFEVTYGCPYCGGAYAEALLCTSCDEYITGDYIKTADGGRYCERCCCHMELGEE